MSEATTNETRDAAIKETAATGGAGGLGMEISGGDARLLVHAIRALAAGAPLTAADVEGFASAARVPDSHAEAFLRTITERDDDGNIVGVLGLSLKNHPHTFSVGGVDMTTWCALDTLFLPRILRAPARVTSKSPASGTPVSLTVTPDGIRDADPQTVVTLVAVDAMDGETRTTEAIMMAFCRNIHFFPDAAEAEAWAATRPGITVATLDEAFEHGATLWPEAFEYAEGLG
jgi:alkylmercury lyase